MHAMWDPFRERFLIYYKIWKVTGETPDPDSPTGFRPVTRYFCKFKRTLRDDGLIELRGKERIFHPESVAEADDEAVLVLRTDEQETNDGGGGQLAGARRSERVIGWAESDDFQHWRHERVVLECDQHDRPDANIQYAFVMTYGSYYLGFLTLHDERGRFEQQFAFSRDGVTWSRPWRGNFIGLGTPEAFDSGMVLAPTDPILTNTQMLFYYGGFDYLHHYHTAKPKSTPWSAAIGRGILRRDGFASWDSLPGAAGVLTTQPLQTAQRALYVNADAGGGQLTVEVLDEHGQAVPGFEADQCVPITEDTSRFAHCVMPVRWESGVSIEQLIEQLQERPFRLRFHLRGHDCSHSCFASSERDPSIGAVLMDAASAINCDDHVALQA